jgi:hypothetical protein
MRSKRPLIPRLPLIPKRRSCWSSTAKRFCAARRNKKSARGGHWPRAVVGNISSMNMRERGLIGTRPLLFVVKVKRPRFGVLCEAFSDLGGGKAV